MITIELRRSGGLMGRSASAKGQFDVEEEVVTAKLKQAAPEPDPMARDELYYTMMINGLPFEFDPGKLKGDVKKIFTKLEPKLKVVP